MADLCKLLKNLTIQELQQINEEVKKIIKEKSDELKSNGEVVTISPDRGLNLAHLGDLDLVPTVERQLKLLNTLSKDGLLTYEDAATQDYSCTCEKKCEECGRVSCLCGILDDDLICIVCESKQIKSGLRTELIYRPYSK